MRPDSITGTSIIAATGRGTPFKLTWPRCSTSTCMMTLQGWVHTGLHHTACAWAASKEFKAAGCLILAMC